MTLLLSMLPLYLVGNLHCAGMCGPLVLMIGQHRFRYFYLVGRLLSFTLAGAIAGEAGAVVDFVLKQYQIPAIACFFFGFAILAIGFMSLLGISYPGYKWLANKTKPFNQSLSLLILQDKPFATFLFGFFTLVLPCGQTLIVFSACALSGDLWVGLINGFVFALLTSPSLVLAMHAHHFFFKFKHHYKLLLGLSALLIGTLSICRGFAEIDLIPHLILNQRLHIILY